MTVTVLHLVRHGEASWSEPDPGGLSASGRAQATALGRRLVGEQVDLVRHGPLPRAAQTARILAVSLGAPVEESAYLRDLTPIPRPEQAALLPRDWRAFLDAVPAGERDEDGVALRAAVDALLTVGDADRCEVLVTHAFVIGWVVRHVLDAPDWRWMGLNPAPASLTTVQVTTGAPPTLVRYNDQAHLG